MKLRAGLMALALGLLGAACTGEVVDGRASADETPSAGGSADPHGDLACDAETQTAIDATIDGQLAAFADGDYGAALAFATEDFQAGTSAEAFAEVIESDYPLLRGASGHTSSVCVAEGDQAQLIVVIEGTDGASDELVYRMAQEAGEWRIAVAAHVPEAGSEEPVPV